MGQERKMTEMQNAGSYRSVPRGLLTPLLSVATVTNHPLDISGLPMRSGDRVRGSSDGSATHNCKFKTQ